MFKKSKDPTSVDNFNTYKFAEYKESQIEMLKRVCMVSVEMAKIVEGNACMIDPEGFLRYQSPCLAG